MDPMKRNSLLAAAKQLCDLMYGWNVVDVYELVIDNPGDGGSVYYHVNKALIRALGHLGVAKEDAYTFYDLVTQGQTPQEALEAALARQAERMA